MRRRRSQQPIKFTLRFYPGQDDDLIRWLDGLDEKQVGAKAQTIKEMLRQVLGSKAIQGARSAGVWDLAEVRRVVEAGVTSALARLEGQRIGCARPVQADEDDDEVEMLLGALDQSLVLRDDGGDITG
ncbi:MAG: hypothetical protein JXA14_22120 [Anaerolineae bacterium]|nr:hypothetical protein [Anaerolineae bacterium]